MIKAVDDLVLSTFGGKVHPDVCIVAVAIVALTVLRYLVAGYDGQKEPLCPPLFNILIDKSNVAKPKKTYKLAESLWYLCWHVTSLACTICLLAHEYGTHAEPKWLSYFLKDHKGMWFIYESVSDVGHEISWPNISMADGVRMLNLISMGFWMSCCLYIHWETRRSDIQILRFHHFTTVILILLNYTYRFHRIGLLIIILHDIPDVLLFTTKCLSYLRLVPDLVTGAVFLIYGTSHFVCRLVLLGAFVARPLFFNIGSPEIYEFAKKYMYSLPGGVLCICLLTILTVGWRRFASQRSQVMNIYWLNLIVSMIRKFASGAEISKCGHAAA
ncbi:Protein ASC1-like protein [Babesia bigemina]|uniref:Protein ASC1-like protein n=1 Tax=Babesia bigemina TaxID=5866 RepID=A0A061D8W8_BABBI|nr:Protein ASC1-like protein [Babesia bigemina]CDR96993.1 Protein ASC1-like protein [Babesia bigemina]|eukprot:XP_012769179.1 Protein ASC1-like protein [Babesia bigemina]